MGLEDVLKFAFHASKEHPKILLPAVIAWIPQIIITVAAAFFLSDFSFRSFLETARNLDALLVLFGQVGLFLLGYTVVSWIITALMQGLYTYTTYQFANHKEPNIAEAFYTGQQALLPLLWIQTLTAFLIIGLLIGAGLIGLVGVVAGGVFGGLVVGLAFVLAFVGTFYIVFKSWLTPVALVLENQHGLNAIRRSWVLTKGKVWQILVLLFVIGIVQVVVNSATSAVPLVGFTLTLLTMLFFTVWIGTAPAALYYEYGLAKHAHKKKTSR